VIYNHLTIGRVSWMV